MAKSGSNSSKNVGKLRIEYLSTDALKPYEGNAKIHTDEQLEQIAESIRLFGMNDPIAIWHGNEIIEGHGRLIACQRLGMAEVPVIRLDGLTDEQRRAYMNVHNQLTMNTGFDLELLNAELWKIESIDMEKFGFDIADFLPEQNEWFDNHEQNDQSRQEGNNEYNEFLDKFEEKKTTDDCYTPQNVYDGIADYVAEHYGLKRERFIRPFYPGGDFENEKYPPGCVVVDNPPFSILSKIIHFYNERQIPYFLFAPELTIIGSARESCAVIVSGNITYENGAVVATSFVTSLEEGYAVKTSPELYQIIKRENDANTKSQRELPSYEYPPELLTAAMARQFSRYGVEYALRKEDCVLVRELDAMKDTGKGIYGSGLLLSEKAAAEKQAAEKQAAEKAEQEKKNATAWKLSDRERDIIRGLG